MQEWVINELKGINFGDKRLNARCHHLLDGLASAPDKSIPTTLDSWSESKAAYRFFSNEKVNEEKILEPHIEATIKRVKQEKIVLMLQDTTEVDCTDHQGIDDLGFIGNKTTQDYHRERRGFFIHPTIAVTPDRLNLGIIDNIMWKRDAIGIGVDRKKKEIKDKESYNWLRSFQKVKKLAKEIPNTEFINIGDRECDIYEYFIEYDATIPNANFIVRSVQNRVTNNMQKLWDRARESNIITNIKFELPRDRGRKARIVEQEIRVVEVEMISPKRYTPKLPNVKLFAILASEVGTTDKNKIEWLLLTTLQVTSIQDALNVIEYYLCRWQIELYFKTLKSGCKIEDLQLKNYSKLKSCIAIYMIIAWRIQCITMLRRRNPNSLCNNVFSKSEWEAVYRILHKNKPPERIPTMHEMIRMIAQLGGFLGRKHDGEPGLKTIWIGMQKAKDYALAWEIFNLQANTCG